MKIFALAFLCFWHADSNGGSNARLNQFLQRLQTLHEQFAQDRTNWSMPNPVMYMKDPRTGLMYSVEKGRIYDPQLHFSLDLKKDVLLDWESGRRYRFHDLMRDYPGVVRPRLIQ